MITMRRRPIGHALSIRLRVLRRRWHLRAPVGLRQAAPWTTSLLAHLAILLVLALLVHVITDDSARRPDLSVQLRDDVSTLLDADRSGDPFTTLDALEPPSLTTEPTPTDTQVAVVSMPPSMRFAPEIDIKPSEPAGGRALPAGKGIGPNAASGPGSGAGPHQVAAPLTGRQGPARAALVRREGGTVESEKAVEAGLEWIARHQRADGGWSLDTTDACSQAPGCPPVPCMVSDSGATGLALLPLLAAGHTHTDPGPYQNTLRAGLRWIIRSQQPDGSLYVGGTHHTLMYSHAIATMALCESYALTGDEALKAPAKRAVRFIIRSQNPAGGWRYQPNAQGDTSVFGWMIFALRSANLAGIGISSKEIARARRYLNAAAYDKSHVTYCYMVGFRPSMSMTAEGLVCRQYLGWPQDHPALRQGSALLFNYLQESTDRNIYLWYYATQLLHNLHDKHWEVWNAQVRDGLIALQVGGNGCDRGSWNPLIPQTDRWGSKGGRLYITSLSLLTLEVYYRYLPLYQDRGGALETTDKDASAPLPNAENAEPKEPRRAP